MSKAKQFLEYVDKAGDEVLKMTDELFKFRRRIIGFLYEARDIVKEEIGKDLPRIKVRIVDYIKSEEKSILGKCHIDANYITISKDLAKVNESLLRHVVWHELVHAYLGFTGHDESSILMKSSVGDNGGSLKSIEADLRKFAKQYKR